MPRSHSRDFLLFRPNGLLVIICVIVSTQFTLEKALFLGTEN